MSAFTGPLVIEEVQPGRRWRLREPIRYEAGREGSGHWIVVPAGTETDGASIPAALRLILAVWGSYGRAACIHDYLYRIIRTGEQIVTDERGFDLSHRDFGAARSAGVNLADPRAARRWADDEFYTAMRACGTSRGLAFMIWATVRLFGARYCRPSDPVTRA